MKQIYTYIGCLMFSLAILWGGMFGMDCYRTATLQRPWFALAYETACDGGSGIYRGPGYAVEIDGELSAEYGYVVHKAELTFLGRVVAAAIE